MNQTQIKKLHLGCGDNYMEGWTNLDINPEVNPDVCADIEKGLPFADDTFDVVYSKHVIEHIHNFIPLMAELNRICKNRARIKIDVPHALSIAAYQDPTHKRFFTYLTFDYFTDNAPVDYGFTKFKIISKRLNYLVYEHQWVNVIMNPLINIFPRFYERIVGWIFPCGELKCELEVIK